MLLSISRLMIDTVQDLDWSYMEIYFAKKLHIFSYLLIPTKRHRWIISVILNNFFLVFPVFRPDVLPPAPYPKNEVPRWDSRKGPKRERLFRWPLTIWIHHFFNIIPPLFKLILVRFCLNMWNWNLIRIWSNVWRIPISKLNYNCKTYTTYLHWKRNIMHFWKSKYIVFCT